MDAFSLSNRLQKLQKLSPSPAVPVKVLCGGQSNSPSEQLTSWVFLTPSSLALLVILPFAPDVTELHECSDQERPNRAEARWCGVWEAGPGAACLLLSLLLLKPLVLDSSTSTLPKAVMHGIRSKEGKLA